MDVFLIPIADIVKHQINQNYITYDDSKLNAMLYSLMAVIIGFIVKMLVSITIKEPHKYMKWYFEYVILKKKNLIIPYNGQSYSPYKFEQFVDGFNTCLIIHEQTNISIFIKTVAKIIEEFIYKFDNKDNHLNNYYYQFVNKKTNINFNRMFNIKNDLNLISTIREGNKYVEFAYINGYVIYIDIEYSYYNSLYLRCANREILNIFMEHINQKYKQYFQNDVENNSLNVYEFEDVNVGLVKPQLTFDNFISVHKSLILKHLNKFKENKINEENIFIDNNLGFLVHGTYGTGKTFLISAIANYLNRSIYNINFAKIKTKSEFRKIMNKDNISKYVFCFDEFDYLLSSVLDKNKNDSEKNLHLKIQILSQQISTVKEKESASEIIKEMKKIMEDGTSDELTYEFMLSELSGITSVNDRIIVATTNFINDIPDALKRPGRFDIILHFDKFNKTEIIELLIKLYKPSKQQITHLSKIKFKESVFTPAEIIIKRNCYEHIDDMIKYLS